jgi:hypothetical protein
MICKADLNSNFLSAFSCSLRLTHSLLPRRTRGRGGFAEGGLMFGDISREIVVFFFPHQGDIAFLLVFITTQV